MQQLETSAERQLSVDPAAALRQARDKLAAARVWLMREKPFFGILARALRLEPTFAVPAFRLWPDDRLQTHPVVVLQLRLSAISARLAHVSLHAALGAFVRRRDHEPARWNLAHDLAIEPLLEAAQLATGAAVAARQHEELFEALRDVDPGASAEAIYEQLPAGCGPAAQWCDLCDPPPSESSSPPSKPSPPPRGGAGGATAGEAEPGEAEPDEPQPRAALHELGSLSAEERARSLQWTMRLAAAYEEELRSGGKTFGDMPAWLDAMIRANIEPPANWTAILQQAVSTLKRSERSYLRPSRRMSALLDADGRWPDTVSMPGRRIEQAGQLVAVVDTSASVQPATLSRFLGAIVAAATAEGIDEVRLLCADAAVARDERVFAAELLFREIAIAGRGGTDFREPLRQLAAESKSSGQSFTVVYLTDLDGRFPEAGEVAHLDVLWVVPAATQRKPPFGRLLHMVQPRRTS